MDEVNQQTFDMRSILILFCFLKKVTLIKDTIEMSVVTLIKDDLIVKVS